MSLIAHFPWGWLGTIGDNEIEVVSTMKDPPKIRMAVVADKVESNLGSFCFNLRRTAEPDDDRHDELGYIMGRLTANKRQGALYVALAPKIGQSCREVLYVDPGAAIFRVPVQAPNLGSVTTPPNELRHPNGIHWLVLQGDGNFVAYRNRVPFDYGTGEPYWASNTINP